MIPFNKSAPIFALFLCTGLLDLPPSTSGQMETHTHTHHFVEPGLVLVESWEGWGTSLAWWADMLGGMEDIVFKNVTDAFFNKDKLNFNIVRYTIGGTTPEEVEPYPCGDYRAGAATESFRDGLDKPYNWTRDPRQVKVLQEAISHGVNILEAFSNSPPQWMTVSGCAKGNWMRFPLHDNLDPPSIPDFVTYATDVLEHFRTELGISFNYYAPFNEPFGLAGIGGWFGRDTEQEGCNMKRETMVEVIRQMATKFGEKGMDYVTLTGADETQINTAIPTANYFLREGVAGLLSKWNVHGYWDYPDVLTNRRDLLNIIAHRGAQKLWMDEMGWGSTPPEDMTQALDISRRILSDLKDMNPSAWVYWQAMESTGQWGVISVPYRFNATMDEVTYNSGYFGMMQFSHYIKQGYQLIFVNDPETLAAFDPATKTLVLVCVHEPNTPVTKSFDLARFSGENLTISAITRTSSTEKHVPVPDVAITNGTVLVATIAPTSITTLVISGVELFPPESPQERNQLWNGDFEEENGSPGWSLINGNASLPVTSGELPWRGYGHGAIPPNYWDERVLSQTLDGVWANGSLYLTLHASTEGSNTWIEVWVGDNKVGAQVLHHLPGYRGYGLAFKATSKELVTIRIRAGPGNGPIFVDNARVYALGGDPATTTPDPSSPTPTPTPDPPTSSSGGIGLESVVLLMNLFAVLKSFY